MTDTSNTDVAVMSIMTDAFNDSAAIDFENARANIHEAVEVSKAATAQLAEIASQSQHPLAFDVLGKLVTATVNASEALMRLQVTIRKIQEIDKPITGDTTINNNLFVGSTAELQTMIENLQKNGTRPVQKP